MITIQYTRNGKPMEKQVPTCWDDVSWEQYVRFLETERGWRQVEILIGPDFWDLNSDQMDVIAGLIDFLNHPNDMLIPALDPPINVAAESWEKLEKAKAILAESGGDLTRCATELVGVYAAGDLGQQPAPIALGFAYAVKKKWRRFLKTTPNFPNQPKPFRRKWRLGCLTMEVTFWKSSPGWRR